MAFTLLDKVTAIGASKAIKLARGITEHTVEAVLDSQAATVISAATVILQGSIDGSDKDTGIVTQAALAIDTTQTRFANGAFTYRIDNTNYTIDADAAGNTFTLAHVVAASLYGAINIYANTAGAFVTRVPLATQSYASAAAAHTAADLVPTPPDEVLVGRILILNDAGAWTANTHDLDATDLATATFLSYGSTFYDVGTHAFTAAEITAKRCMFHVTVKGLQYIRVFLSVLTGTGYVTVRYFPIETY